MLRRFQSTPSFLKLRSEPARKIDEAARRAQAEQLAGKRPAGVSAGLVASASMLYTSQDLLLAITEQTELYHNAENAFYNKLLEIAGSGEVPDEQDVAELATYAYDVWLWQTSLNILAAVWNADGYWDWVY